MTPDEIPRLDAPGPGVEPRAVQFNDTVQFNNTGSTLRSRGFLGRRGFLAVVGTAAMTLGMTMLGWIPLARPAGAKQGAEYPDCGRYSNGPGGPICYGAPYSPSYCGKDKWFKDGCFGKWEDGLDCYRPRAICRAGEESREAWRWEADGVAYRCADGQIHYSGAPNLEQVICNAKLVQPDTAPSRATLHSLPSLAP